MDSSALLLAVSALVLGGVVYFLLSLKWSLTGNLGNRTVNPLKGNSKDPLSLYGFFVPVEGLTTSISPFTSKVETYLRMNGIKFTSENTDFKSSPNGRVSSALRILKASLWSFAAVLMRYGSLTKT